MTALSKVLPKKRISLSLPVCAKCILGNLPIYCSLNRWHDGRSFSFLYVTLENSHGLETHGETHEKDIANTDKKGNKTTLKRGETTK